MCCDTLSSIIIDDGYYFDCDELEELVKTGELRSWAKCCDEYYPPSKIVDQYKENGVNYTIIQDCEDGTLFAIRHNDDNVTGKYFSQPYEVAKKTRKVTETITSYARVDHVNLFNLIDGGTIFSETELYDLIDGHCKNFESEHDLKVNEFGVNTYWVNCNDYYTIIEDDGFYYRIDWHYIDNKPSSNRIRPDSQPYRVRPIEKKATITYVEWVKM